MTRASLLRPMAMATVLVVATSSCSPAPVDEPGATSTTAHSGPTSTPASATPMTSYERTTVTPSPATSQAELNQQLREAAWDDDVEQAAELLRQGADVNAKDDTTQSTYLISTSEGYLELLRLSLANGASINDKDSWNGTGLIRAAERGHWLVVGELVQAGIDLDHVNRIGFQAIHEAVWLGKDNQEYATTVRVLVASGAELTRPSGNEALTPLAMAQQRQRGLLEPTLVRALAATAIADPDSGLLTAARDGDADGVALALRAGADIEARDSKDRTPLLLAATGDHVEAARVLIALGADPDALDDRHDTPWLVTGVTGSVPMLNTMMSADPDLTILNRFGGTSLIPASERGHVAYVERVISTGIDVNHVNDLGWTALLEAVILGDGGQQHRDIVGLLLDAGADPSIADSAGVTALQHARSKNFSEMAALLEAS